MNSFFGKHFGLGISDRAIRAMNMKKTKFGLEPDLFHEVILMEPCGLLESKEDLENCDSLRHALRKLKKELNLSRVSVSLPETRTRNIETIAIPENVIKAYKNLFKQEKIIPLSFELESNPIIRSVIRKENKDPHLLINFDHNKINLVIVENRSAKYVHHFPFSSKEVTDDIEGSIAMDFKNEVNHFLNYWFTNRINPENDEIISNVIIAGPFALNEGLTHFLERSLKANIKVANVWENCFDLDNYIPHSVSHKTSLRYSPIIGLFLD
jgi:hypothetical protein